MNRFTKFLYALLMLLVFTIATTFAQCPNGTYVNIVINPDQFPQETSWAIIGVYEDTIATGGPYDNIIGYQPQVTQVCIPNGDYLFNISDLYGDGVAGSLWGGQDGSYYVMHCGDTLVQPDSANFGFSAFHGFTLEDCAPPPPVFGCMDNSFIEFLPVATVDTGMCFTPKVFGCTEEDAFNYEEEANTDILTDSCAHTLELTDLAGNGWAGAYVQVVQGDNFIGEFTLEDGFEETFTFNLSTSEPVEVKFFTTNQSQFTSVQCGYALYSEEHTAIDAPGGFANPLIPFVFVYGMPYCGSSCIEKIYGCIDDTALNYNDGANTDDESCYYVEGCTNPIYIEYNEDADFDNETCATLIVLGCMDSTALNYNPEANTEIEGSCVEVVEGCTDNTMFNFNVNANLDDESCISYMYGCTDVTALNYDSLANTDDGTCIAYVWGCTDGTAFNYNSLANSDDGSCIDVVFGCTNNTMWNYDLTANTDNGSCIPFYYGCTDSTAINYDDDANSDNGSCIYPVPGCNDPSAINYNPLVNVADSSCYYSAGCYSGDVYYIPDACFEWVIGVDPYCCNTTWDDGCDGLYAYCADGWTGPTDIAMFERMGILPYPNPSNGLISFNSEVDVKIYDELGRLVYEANKVLDVELDTGKGFYLVKISKDNLSITNKIIIK